MMTNQLLTDARSDFTGRSLRVGRPSRSSRKFGPIRALFTKKKAPPAPPPKEKKQGFLSQFTEAIDFAQVRSESDRDLLDRAKATVGRKGGRKGEKMSREQYQALRRKVGGTAKDYWKDYIEADEMKGYKSTESASIPALPFLIAVVLGLVVATGVVVTQTSPAAVQAAAEAQQQ